MEKNHQEKIKNVMEKACTNKAFRENLINDTKATLKAEGIALKEGRNVFVHQNTKEEFYFVVPMGKNQAAEEKKNLPRNPSFVDLGLWATCQIQNNTLYKDKLINSPNETLKELGVELPGNPKIHIVQNTKNEAHFVIPSNIENQGELQEYELEQVAGGKGLLGGSSSGGGLLGGKSGQDPEGVKSGELGNSYGGEDDWMDGV